MAARTEWDLMRERLVRFRTKAELQDIARREGAPCSGYKEDVAAQIVARRRRLAEGRPEPPSRSWGDYRAVETAPSATSGSWSET